MSSHVEQTYRFAQVTIQKECIAEVTAQKTMQDWGEGIIQHIEADIFQCIFLNGNIWISINISLRCVPKGPINNFPALVQITAWRRPLSEPMMITRPQRVKAPIK